MGFTWLMGLKGTVGMGLDLIKQVGWPWPATLTRSAAGRRPTAAGGRCRRRSMVGGDGGVRSYFILDN